jgi:hypothetical protein
MGSGCADSKTLSDVVFRGSKYALHSFSLNRGFVPLGFPGKVFNEAACHAYRNTVYSFSFTGFLSHRVFPSKVLTRHIYIDGHPRGSVINLLFGN